MIIRTGRVLEFFLLFFVVVSRWMASEERTVWTTDGRYILKDGEVFTMKGVNYSPVPAGAPTDEAGGYGDIFSNDWSFVHDRDFPLLRAMNANTIRVYTWRVDDGNLAHDYFLDQAWNNGNDPVFVLITFSFGTTSHLSVQGRETLKRNLKDICEKYGNHDAIMGFVLGNENNNGPNRESREFWQFINELGAIVKQYAPDKLTTITVVDDSMITVKYAVSYEFNGEKDMPTLDFWGINSYRGDVSRGFDILFDSYAEITGKPLIIGEFGPPASTRDEDGNVMIMPDNAALQADYLEVHWRDMMHHHCICQGGLVFVWTDEWWKAGQIQVQNPSEHQNGAFPGGWWDEEYFGINGIEPVGDITEFRTRGADKLKPRAAYYIQIERREGCFSKHSFSRPKHKLHFIFN